MQIEVQHVHKRFGPVHANNDISLTFHGGRIVGILGENGAGKSTLMKILAGYQGVDSGTILLDGRAARLRGPQEAIHAGIGMLQQDPLDIPAFSVLENLIYGGPGGLLLSRRTVLAQFRQLSQRFGFALDPETPVANLTIGQRQQMEILRLLALGVKALILDEPTTGISAEQKDTLFQTLRQLAQEDGLSVLLVSHKLEDVIALCDEVAVLRAGQVVGTRAMPATTGELVAMMFGQPLAPPSRPTGEYRSARAALEVEHLNLRGGRVTIQDFSLSIRAGEVVGLAGLDGSGQELLLRACTGLVQPSAGRIRLNGEVVRGGFHHFRQRGVAFGAAGRLEEGLIANLTITEHMALVSGDGAIVDWGRARAVTEQRIKQYDVRGRPQSLMETLSGGNQQRVLMALLPERPVLLALEQPTRGLDVESARWIWQQLLQRRAAGAAILFSSPDLEELVTYSDRILVFFAGRAMEIRDVAETSTDELGRAIGGHFDG